MNAIMKFNVNNKKLKLIKDKFSYELEIVLASSKILWRMWWTIFHIAISKMFCGNLWLYIETMNLHRIYIIIMKYWRTVVEEIWWIVNVVHKRAANITFNKKWIINDFVISSVSSSTKMLNLAIFNYSILVLSRICQCNASLILLSWMLVASFRV